MTIVCKVILTSVIADMGAVHARRGWEDMTFDAKMETERYFFTANHQERSNRKTRHAVLYPIFRHQEAKPSF